GLGQALIDELEKSVSEILEYPEAFELVSKNLRRKVLRRFPYGLIYAIGSDRIRILAIAHHKRRPEYWRYRLA
ncbi:MAG TPA: type II toxin-antitoxin system RelE/ParE family toxin, partial [Desulfuromonadales bacterium]|nr:type II toxin-antitoxin system RelE/ParE family toxin [Desulfuromonadales bacterium]